MVWVSKVTRNLAFPFVKKGDQNGCVTIILPQLHGGHMMLSNWTVYPVEIQNHLVKMKDLKQFYQISCSSLCVL